MTRRFRERRAAGEPVRTVAVARNAAEGPTAAAEAVDRRRCCASPTPGRVRGLARRSARVPGRLPDRRAPRGRLRRRPGRPRRRAAAGVRPRLNARPHDAHAGTMGESDLMLDTHAVARSLTAADFTPAQADALTDALRLVVEQGEHVTSDHVQGRPGRDARPATHRNRGGTHPDRGGTHRDCEPRYASNEAARAVPVVSSFHGSVRPEIVRRSTASTDATEPGCTCARRASPPSLGRSVPGSPFVRKCGGSHACPGA